MSDAPKVAAGVVLFGIFLVDAVLYLQTQPTTQWEYLSYLTVLAASLIIGGGIASVLK